MGFSWQEYWSGLSCPSPGDLSNPGIEPMSLMSPALANVFFTTSATWKSQQIINVKSLQLPFKKIRKYRTLNTKFHELPGVPL